MVQQKSDRTDLPGFQFNMDLTGMEVFADWHHAMSDAYQEIFAMEAKYLEESCEFYNKVANRDWSKTPVDHLGEEYMDLMEKRLECNLGFFGKCQEVWTKAAEKAMKH